MHDFRTDPVDVVTVIPGNTGCHADYLDRRLRFILMDVGSGDCKREPFFCFAFFYRVGITFGGIIREKRKGSWGTVIIFRIDAFGCGRPPAAFVKVKACHLSNAVCDQAGTYQCRTDPVQVVGIIPDHGDSHTDLFGRLNRIVRYDIRIAGVFMSPCDDEGGAVSGIASFNRVGVSFRSILSCEREILHGTVCIYGIDILFGVAPFACFGKIKV